jgi:putative ABC transport system permease protein
MRFKDLFLLSTRMFKARTSRTFLTILGMSVGIGAIIFLVSLGYGLQNTLLEKITTSDSLLTLDVTSPRSGSFQLNQKAVEDIRAISGVAEVSPAYELSARGNMNNLSTDLTVTAVNPLYLKLGGMKSASGQLLNDNNVRGVMVSSSVAKIFNLSSEEIIGKSISFIFYISKDGSAESSISRNKEEFSPQDNFEIIGVMDADDNSVYINSKSLSDIPTPPFSQFKVKCQGSDVMPAIQEKITGLGFLVSSISDTVDQTNKIFRIIKIILMLFGFIALVVSAIGMFNTMTITLLERTEEIGIMKSIGASDMMISLMFMMESTIMGFLGGLVGIIIGFLEGQLFNFMINLIATHFGGEKVNLFSSPIWFVATVIAFSALVGFSTGIVPARRASKIDPLEALRYK